MSMAIEVNPPVYRPGSLPRSCSKEDGSPKAVYMHRKVARKAARLLRPDRPGLQAYRCAYAEHYHLGHQKAHRALACARCGREDHTVAQTTTADGLRWPPTCSECAAKANRVRQAVLR